MTGAQLKTQRRTFEAANHPKGSPERERLNCHGLTSEYLRGQRYIVTVDRPAFATARRRFARRERLTVGANSTSTTMRLSASVSGGKNSSTTARVRMVQVAPPVASRTCATSAANPRAR